MPSSATITAFYSFTANTKARATFVNTNFSNYRGHIIAIDPNTATAAATETYDLGSTEYRWRTGYFRDIDIKANTTTGQALSIIGDTAAGQGAFLFKQGGNVRARIGGGNQYIDCDTTTGQFDFRVGGITTSAYKIGRSSFYNSTGSTAVKIIDSSYNQFTTTANISQIALSVGLSVTSLLSTTTYYQISGLTATLTTVGKPIEIYLVARATSTGSEGIIDAPNSFILNFLRSGTTIASYRTSIASDFPVGGFRAFDLSPAAGTYNYGVEIRVTGITTFGGCYLLAKEV